MAACTKMLFSCLSCEARRNGVPAPLPEFATEGLPGRSPTAEAGAASVPLHKGSGAYNLSYSKGRQSQHWETIYQPLRREYQASPESEISWSEMGQDRFVDALLKKKAHGAHPPGPNTMS